MEDVRFDSSDMQPWKEGCIAPSMGTGQDDVCTTDQILFSGVYIKSSQRIADEAIRRAMRGRHEH